MALRFRFAFKFRFRLTTLLACSLACLLVVVGVQFGHSTTQMAPKLQPLQQTKALSQFTACRGSVVVVVVVGCYWNANFIYIIQSPNLDSSLDFPSSLSFCSLEGLPFLTDKERERANYNKTFLFSYCRQFAFGRQRAKSKDKFIETLISVVIKLRKQPQVVSFSSRTISRINKYFENWTSNQGRTFWKNSIKNFATKNVKNNR